jgi:hypothetical protein
MKESTKEAIEKKNIKRNRQLASLMIKNPFFQFVIKEWREKLGIPINGFSDTRSFEAYYRKKEKEFETPTPSKELTYESFVYKKYRVFLRNEVQKILEATGFMHNMADVAEQYLYFNVLPECDSFYLKLPYCIDYPDEFADPWTKMGIVIDDSTTIEEIKAIWPEVMDSQLFRKAVMPLKLLKERREEGEDIYKVMTGYKRKPQFKEIKNMERDELIIKLKKEGLKGNEIQRKIREMGYGVIGYEDVSKIIQRYDAKVGT